MPTPDTISTTATLPELGGAILSDGEALDISGVSIATVADLSGSIAHVSNPATASVASVDATSAVGAITFTSEAIALPSVIAATATIEAAETFAGADTTVEGPGTIAAVATLPSADAIAQQNSTMVAVVINTTAAFGLPALANVFSPDTIAAVAGIPPLTGAVFQSFVVDVIAATASIGSPTVDLVNGVAAETIATLATVPDPAAQTGQTSAPGVIIASIAIPSPALDTQIGFLGLPNTVEGSAALDAPTVTGSSNANTPADNIFGYAAFGLGSAPGIYNPPPYVPFYALMQKLNQLAGTEDLELAGAANAWAGTEDLEFIGALNVKAGTVGLEFNAVAKMLALQNGGNPFMDGYGAIISIPEDDVAPTPTSSTQAVTTILAAASLPAVTVGA